MSPSEDVQRLIEVRQRYGVKSRTYRRALEDLADTAEAIGVERFLDDLAGRLAAQPQPIR